MSSLIECFDKYQGKNYDLDGTDKGTTHSYLELYQNLLTPQKETFKNVVEIGVRTGGSCVAFSDFFTNGKIYGVDIDLNNLIYGLDNPNIKYIEGDGTNETIIEKLNLNEIDMVLDDGSHDPNHQIMTAKIFLPLISKNGLFICEDINQSHANFIKTNFTELAEQNQMKMDWYDLRHIKNRFDDIVAVIYRK